LSPISLYTPPQGLALGVSPGASVFIPDLGQAGQAYFPGTQQTVAWDGANDNGQLVGGGVYTLMATYTSSEGVTSHYSVSMQVLRQPQALTVQVFNSAGELVRTLSVPAGTGAPSAPSLVAAFVAPAQAGPGQGLRIGLGPSLAAWWDGRNDLGAPAASGPYLLKVTWPKPGGAPQLYNATVTLLAAPQGDPLATAWMGPNPLHSGQGPLVVGLDPGVDASTLHGRVYTLAGELVGQLSPDASWRLAWAGSGAAGGVYLLELTVTDASGHLRHRLLKVAVIQ
jgi:hypothetical protein